MTLEWTSRTPEGPPRGALVVLHGRGSDMLDSLGLGTALDPARQLLVAAPQAPMSLPPGGWHWYELGGLPTPEPSSFTASMSLLGEWISELPGSTGVPLERTVVAGFSQGCMMTWGLAAGPHPPKLAATIHIAGFLPQVDGYDLDLARMVGQPALVVHGTHDPVIDVTWGRGATAAARAAGIDARWVEAPAAHDVDVVGACAMIDFLGEVLGV